MQREIYERQILSVANSRIGSAGLESFGSTSLPPDATVSTTTTPSVSTPITAPDLNLTSAPLALPPPSIDTIPYTAPVSSPLPTSQEIPSQSAGFATSGFTTSSPSTPSFATSSFVSPGSATSSSATSSVVTSSFATSSFATSSFATASFPTSVLASTSSASPSTSATTTASNVDGSSPACTCKSSTGAIAGAATGSAVGIALICTVIVALIFNKSRLRRRSQTFTNMGGALNDRDAKVPLPASLKHVSHETTAIDPRPAWERNFPQPLDDITIQRRIKAVFDQIDLHVEHFYHDKAVHIDSEKAAELSKVDSAYLPAGIVEAMRGTRHPTVVIKHCITNVIVMQISPCTDTQESLLPSEFTLLPRAITKQGLNSSNQPGFSQSFSKWRTLTAYLRPPSSTDTRYLKRRNELINTTAFAISAAFRPWVKPNTAASLQHRDVVNLMQNAAEVGIMLFSQPSGFDFRWDSMIWMPREQGSEIMMPALVKVTDDEGQTLERPQLLLGERRQKF